MITLRQSLKAKNHSAHDLFRTLKVQAVQVFDILIGNLETRYYSSNVKRGGLAIISLEFEKDNLILPHTYLQGDIVYDAVFFFLKVGGKF